MKERAGGLPVVTRSDLVMAFQSLGLKTGDSVIVHSSFRGLGEVEGGPVVVLDALLQVMGETGNLMLPTFNYTHPLPEPYYDPAETPCRTGIIPETGRKLSGAVRSLHPTHSVAVIGRDSEELTRDHLKYRAFGIGSPLDRLAQRGGKVLLLGVQNTSNSMVHVAEEHAGIPKTAWHETPPLLKVRTPDGAILRHELDTSPSCSAAFGGVAYPLRRRGLIRDSRIGGALLQLMVGAEVIDCVCEILREKPDVLLCTWPECRPCVGARRQLREQGFNS